MVIAFWVLVAVVVAAAVIVRHVEKKKLAANAAYQEAEAIVVANARKRRSDLGTKRTKKVNNGLGVNSQLVPSGEAVNASRQDYVSAPALTIPWTLGDTADEPLDPSGSQSSVPSTDFSDSFAGGESGGGGASGSWEAGTDSTATADAGSSDSGVSGDSGGSGGGD